MNYKSFYIGFLIASLVGALTLAIFAFDLPTWSEEQGWLTIGKGIAAGEILNPIAPKSDYPSSIQAFPLGLLIAFGLQPIAASRLIAILYAVAAAYFLGKISTIFSNENSSLRFTTTLASLLTYNTALYVLTGWHEVTHVNLLSGASTFFFLCLLYDKSRNTSSAVILGVFLGISLWTLYTPALPACSIVIVLCLLPSSFVPWRLRSYAFGALALTVIPLLIGLVNSNGSWLQRHYLWIIEGGEWENTQYSAQNHFSDAMGRTLKLVVSILTPQGAGDTWNTSNGIFPEWTLALAAAIGIGASVFDVRKFFAVTIPCVIITVVLILSNTTTWRASILGFYVLLYAVLGLEAIGRIARSGKQKVVLFGVFSIVHTLLFISPMTGLVKGAEDVFVEGRIASDIALKCAQSISDGTIVAHDYFSLILLQATLRGTAKFRFMQRDAGIQNLLKSEEDLALVLSEDKGALGNLEPMHSPVICSGTSHGLSYWVIPLKANAPT